MNNDLIFLHFRPWPLTFEPPPGSSQLSKPSPDGQLHETTGGNRHPLLSNWLLDPFQMPTVSPSPPCWASHCPPFPIWNRLLAQHRTAYCWHSLLLLMCPELTTSCSSGGRVNIWAPGILEHGLGSGGWCPTIQLRSPPGAAVSVYDGGALGAAGPAREGNSANKGGSMSSSSWVIALKTHNLLSIPCIKMSSLKHCTAPHTIWCLFMMGAISRSSSPWRV